MLQAWCFEFEPQMHELFYVDLRLAQRSDGHLALRLAHHLNGGL